ncbi:Tyrosine phosphatase family [Novymonas esmeraldas]|uniref:Tyrosine phosphatase family n=1 Tax=Novymonas esmeraldas TaxID=1808958 RepID=A0AAW0F2R2_9TRYP
MTNVGKTSGPVLVPPSNFAMVEDGVYRSAYPTEATVPYLRHVGITHVVLLSMEQLPGPVKRLLASEVTGKGTSDYLTRGPIRVIEMVDMHTWCVDSISSGDDFSRRDVTRALDFAVDRRWHPVLFACPLGEIQTNVVVGCMRRYQHWALSSIFSECELYTSVSRALRHSILLFIESWDPASYPISAVNVQFRNREMALRERSRVHKERRRHRHAAAANGGARRATNNGSESMEDTEEDEEAEEDGEAPHSGVSDVPEKTSVDGKLSSTISSPRRTQSEVSVASTPPAMQLKPPHADAAFISTSGQRPPMMMRRAAAAAARQREHQQQQRADAHHHTQSTTAERDGRAVLSQLEDAAEAGVVWAEWYVEALRVGEELASRASGSTSTGHGLVEVFPGAVVPPPHVLYAAARNPPALDPRSTFTKESIVEEDDD